MNCKNKTLFEISVIGSIIFPLLLNMFICVFPNFNTIITTIFSLIAISYVIYELIFIKIDKIIKISKTFIVIAIDYTQIFLDKPMIYIVNEIDENKAIYEAQCDKDTGVHDGYEAKNYSWFAFNLEDLKNE